MFNVCSSVAWLDNKTMKVVLLKLVFFSLFLALVSETEAVARKGHRLKRNVLDQLSPAALEQLLMEINDIESNSNTECTSGFKTMDNMIIRTRDSLKNGANFLQALPDVSSALKCRDECCGYSTNHTGTLLTCNVAVFQVHKLDNNPRCFLFDCYNQTTKNFSCLFAANSEFTSFKSTVPKVAPNSQIQELEEVAKTTSTTTTSPTSTAASTTKQTTTTTTASTTHTTSTTTTLKLTTTASTIADIGLTKSSDLSKCSTSECQRMEWQCDNKCCVPLQNVCDSTPHCSDGSDEIGCPTSSFASTSSKTTLTSSTIVTSTTPGSALPPSTTTMTQVSMPSDKKQVDDNDKPLNKNDQQQTNEEAAPIDPEAGAVLPLAIGLAVTAMVLLMVACRVRIMKRKLRRRGKPLTMDESDYLINGMYL